MNAARRKGIEATLNELTQHLSLIEDLQAEEQEAYDAMPEGLQDAERGMAIYEASQYLEEAGGLLGDVIELLRQAAE